MSEDDHVYYRRRAVEEQMAAERAGDHGAAQAHRMLAERYSALIADGVSKRRTARTQTD